MKDCCQKHNTAYCPDCGSKIVVVVNNEAQRIAEQIHDMFCRSSHTDGCGWHYEINNGEHEWLKWTHKSYYEKAQSILQVISVGEFKEWSEKFYKIKAIVRF